MTAFKQYGLLLTLLISTATFADLSVSQKESNYQIHGTTAAQLRTQMNNLGPEAGGMRLDSETNWYVKWHFLDAVHHGLCAITSIDVTAEIISIFPDWVDYDSADSSLQTKWDDFMQHLHAHQKQHIDNGKNAADAIEQMLSEAEPMSTCLLLETTVNKKANDIIATYQAKGKAYDETTKNGATEGVVFP